MSLTPEQQMAQYLSAELTEWNTASLFPEGLGGEDVFRLRAAGEYFLHEREQELRALQPLLTQAAQNQNGVQALQALDEALLIAHEIQRARVYFKLLSVQHPQVQGFADMYEGIANRCNALDALTEALPQPLSHLPEATRQGMLQAVPALGDHMHSLFPEKYGRYPGLNPEQTANLSRQISDAKTSYLHEYHLAHAKGSIKAHDTARLQQTADAFNAMLRTTMTESRALGYSDPLHHFAAWQHLPAGVVANWLDNSAEPAEQAAKTMQSMLADSRFKTLLTRELFPDRTVHKYSWSEARSIVTDALCKFNPNFRPILDEAFEKGWIQSKPLGNNPYGGETYNNLPKAFNDQSHPMVLSEFRGSIFDVIRLAHELGGHCLSIEMANRQRQPLHVADSTLQETFALFSQRLVEDEMLARTTDPVQKASIQRIVADDWYQNLYETTARCRFQQAAYRASIEADGNMRPLGVGELTQMFSSINAPIRYGLAKTDANEATRWANIHHFVTQMPYYNAAYGFATMASAALYNQWQQAAPGHKLAIADSWASIMAQGGTLRFPDAMQHLGIDVYSSNFLRYGTNSVDRAIHDAEDAMDKVSSFKLFCSLKPARMWHVIKEQARYLLHMDPSKAVPPLADGQQAQRPSPSSPAQAAYGIQTGQGVENAAAAVSDPAIASNAQSESSWAARYAQHQPNAITPREPVASWREQALGSQRELNSPDARPHVPTWAI